MSAVKNLTHNDVEHVFASVLNESNHDAFDDAVNAAQKTFRSVLEALSRPGSIVPLSHVPTLPSNVAAKTEHASACLVGLLALARTLCDADTPLWFDTSLQSPALDQYIRFHCGAPILDQDDTENAAFAFIGDAQHMPRLEAFNQGSLAYPDRSTTLIIACPLGVASDNSPFKAVGPGIAPWQSPLSLPIASAAQGEKDILPEWFWDDLSLNHASYPTGVDIIFVDATAQGVQIMALPRSTRVQKA